MIRRTATALAASLALTACGSGDQDADTSDGTGPEAETETPSLVERAKDRGVKDPETIIASFQAATAKWEKIVAEIGEGDWNDDQWAAYADRVYDEIFSKAEF